MDGKNIIDYVDPDIEIKLRKLEEEQEKLQVPDEALLNAEEMIENEELENVRDIIYKSKVDNSLNNNRKLPKVKFNVNSMKSQLQSKGKSSQKAVNRL